MDLQCGSCAWRMRIHIADLSQVVCLMCISRSGSLASGFQDLIPLSCLCADALAPLSSLFIHPLSRFTSIGKLYKSSRLLPTQGTGCMWCCVPYRPRTVLRHCEPLPQAARRGTQDGLRLIDKATQVVGEQLSDRPRWIVAFRWGKRRRRLTSQPSGGCFPQERVATFVLQ